MQDGLKRPRQGDQLVQEVDDEGRPERWQWPWLGVGALQRDVAVGSTGLGGCCRGRHRCSVERILDFGLGTRRDAFLFLDMEY